MDSTEFNMTASQKRSLQKKEKERKKQAAKCTPAEDQQAEVHHAPNPDGVAEPDGEEHRNDASVESDHERTPTEQESSSIAKEERFSIVEDSIAAVATTGVRSTHNDDCKS